MSNLENIGDAMPRKSGRNLGDWAVFGLFGLLGFSFIFDPADKIVGAKIPLFVGFCVAVIVNQTFSRQAAQIPVGVLIFSLAFVIVPLLSVLRYLISDGSPPFEGFLLLKTYPMVFLAFFLIASRIDPLPLLTVFLSALAMTEIALFATLNIYPGFQDYLHDIGESSGLFYVYRRDYGNGLSAMRIYFVTAPLLVISIAWLFDTAMRAKSGALRMVSLMLVALNIIGMVLSGTRANLVAALAMPILVWPVYTRHPFRDTSLVAAALVLMGLFFDPQIAVLFDPAELGNNLKLSLLNDYAVIFGDWKALWFGQGLGAYYYWTPISQTYFITELTYLELFRNFGMIGAIVMLFLLALPAAMALWSKSDTQVRVLAIAYVVYLAMSAINPNFFTSTGMLLLSTVVAEVFAERGKPEIITAGSQK